MKAPGVRHITQPQYDPLIIKTLSHSVRLFLFFFVFRAPFYAVLLIGLGGGVADIASFLNASTSFSDSLRLCSW